MAKKGKYLGHPNATNNRKKGKKEGCVRGKERRGRKGRVQRGATADRCGN